MWANYIVYYWEHEEWTPAGGRLNDCRGNRVSWKAKARTDAEAIRKASTHAAKNKTRFRLDKAVRVLTLRSALTAA